MRNLLQVKCGVVASSVLVVDGIFLLFFFPSIIRALTNEDLKLSPTSMRYKHWKKTPIPVTFDIYIFNWTNPDKFSEGKPAFEEKGPYRFYEVREKVNLTWNANGTITYRQKRTWLHDAQNSNGSLDNDIFTSINGMALSAAYHLRDAGLLTKISLNAVLQFTKQQVSISHPVRQLLFDGYSDEPNSFSQQLPVIKSPIDKFAWFYTRNASYKYDGWFNIGTGEEDMSGLGKLYHWNGRNHTGLYKEECGMVRGYTGDMFPPGMVNRNSTLDFFMQDLCRSVPFQFSSEEEVHGVSALRFHAHFRHKDDGTAPPEDSCYCNGECVPSGFINLTACRFGAPVFGSLPHFLDADPLYLRRVQGLRPDPEKHRYYATVEPTYGIPIDVGARIQLNMLLQPVEFVTLYEKAPRLMFPVLWVDQRITITEPLAVELRRVLMLPAVASALGLCSFILGTVLLAATLVLRVRRGSSPAKPVDMITPAVHQIKKCDVTLVLAPNLSSEKVISLLKFENKL